MTAVVRGKRHLRPSLKAHDVKLQKRLFVSTINGGRKMEDVLKDKRILIVDDEPDILETLKELLDMCIIDSAPNLETAQKFLKNKTYDVAILDIMGVDGYGLLELTNKRGIPAIMLTAHALSADNLVKSIKEGAQSYLPKDQMADISTYLAEIIAAGEKSAGKSRKWLDRLMPFFDKKFGSAWQDQHKEFWEEYDRSQPVTRDEAEKML
jgi:CheY-like chemotaxis protein